MRDPAMKPNPGHLPDEAEGKKVMVELASGRIRGPWPADGRYGCRWARHGESYDIAYFKVAA